MHHWGQSVCRRGYSCSSNSSVCIPQSFTEGMPRRMRDDTMKIHKETLQCQQAGAEQTLFKQHKDFLELELRKFRRRKLLQFHDLERDLLKAVSRDAGCVWAQRVAAAGGRGCQ